MIKWLKINGALVNSDIIQFIFRTDLLDPFFGQRVYKIEFVCIDKETTIPPEIFLSEAERDSRFMEIEEILLKKG